MVVVPVLLCTAEAECDVYVTWRTYQTGVIKNFVLQENWIVKVVPLILPLLPRQPFRNNKEGKIRLNKKLMDGYEPKTSFSPSQWPNWLIKLIQPPVPINLNVFYALMID